MFRVRVLDRQETSRRSSAVVPHGIGLVSVWPTKSFGSKPEPGLANYTRALCDIMTAENYNVHVFANHDANVDAVHPGTPLLDVQRTWRPNGVLTGRKIIRALLKSRVDVAHVQHELFLYGSYSSAFLFPYWLDSLASRIPTVVTIHGVLDPEHLDSDTLRGRLPSFAVNVARFGLQWIFKRIALSRAYKVVHSDHLRDRLLRYGADAETISVVPLPSLLSRRSSLPSREAARAALGLPIDIPVVFSWGFDNGYKGFDILASGFQAFRTSNIEAAAAVLLLGMGPHPKLSSSAAYLADYGERTSRLRSTTGIRVVGFIPEEEVGLYVRAADVAVFAYTKYVAESGPVSVALGCGLPVLLSDVFKAAPEVLRFSPTPSSLANALRLFFLNREEVTMASAKLASSVADSEVQRGYSAAYARAEDLYARAHATHRLD